LSGRAESDLDRKSSVVTENPDSVYATYTPKKVHIKGAKKHPARLVESAAMAAVEPPDVTYTPHLPARIAQEGILSDAQLENVVYAGQAHSQKLADGRRKGYFIGDGTGVGKGRQLAGIIMDNFQQGRKKAVWISASTELINDAKRDWKDLGGQAEDIGLTALGCQAIPLLERHNIIVDVSHLGDKGFWQVAGLAKRPFVASHSNSRAVCDHPRNLTDDQFRAIVKAGGIVGLNFCEYFISDLGPTQPVDCLLAHIRHFVSLGGADHIALGSDYDGAPLPLWLDRSEKLDSAIALMIKSGLEPALAEKICYQNARAFFARYQASAVGEEP